MIAENDIKMCTDSAFECVINKEIAMRQPIRVLVFGVSPSVGGVEEVMMKLVRNIDPNQIRFDFIIYGHSCVYEKEIDTHLGSVFYITPRRESVARNVLGVFEFFSRHKSNYDIIYYNLSALYYNVDFLISAIFEKNYEIIAHRKQLILLGGGLLGFAIIMMTIIRTAFIGGVKEYLFRYSFSSMAKQLTQYFGGLQNVAIGVKAIGLYKSVFTFQSFLKDIFQNVILINYFVSDYNGSTYFFNRAIYGHSHWADQIQPTVMQAYFHYGFVGVILVPAVISLLIIKADDRIKQSSNIIVAAFWCLCAVYLAFFSPGNPTILFQQAFNQMLPLWFLFKLLPAKHERKQVRL